MRTKFYSLKKILEKNAQYNVIYGQRSNGKTYSVLKYGLQNYIKTGECFGKAGSYAIQGIGGKLVDHYDGSLENIIGLPIKEVIEVLGEIYGMEN